MLIKTSHNEVNMKSTVDTIWIKQQSSIVIILQAGTVNSDGVVSLLSSHNLPIQSLCITDDCRAECKYLNKPGFIYSHGEKIIILTLPISEK